MYPVERKALFARGRAVLVILLLLLIPSRHTRAQGSAQPARPPTEREGERSIAGIWRLRLDPTDAGIVDKGVVPATQFPETILLPGSTDQGGFGYPNHAITSLRLTRMYTYRGAAWYEKKVFVPAAWKGKEIFIFLERAHWQTKLWVDGHPVGERESLSTPHRYDITRWAVPGAWQTIRIRVDNSRIYDIGMPHAISEETQTDWNGVIGKMLLEARSRVYLSNVQVYPEPAHKSTRISFDICNRTSGTVQGDVTLRATAGGTGDIPVRQVHFATADSLYRMTVDLPLGDTIRLWNEFHPALYRLKVNLDAGSLYRDSISVTFGMRTFSTKGTRFFINDEPTFIRANVNSEESPLTGYPSMDEAYWSRIFRVCRSYGLNAMRFHSWCPPEAAFDVADRMGFYLEVENSDWRFNIGADSAASGFLSRESDRILRTYGNHPSFMMFCEGNELVGPGRDAFLTGLLKRWKTEDPRHLYAGSSGYPTLPADDYHDLYGPRAQHWKEGLTGRLNKAPYRSDFDYRDVVAKYPVPIISHEVGQWCVYPDYRQIPEYTGVLKPYNYALFQESLRDHHMLDQARDFMMASGKFQVMQKKEELEALLRTPGLGGYQLLELQDFPGQGTAPVGVVDIFWHPKPYTNGREFREFQGPRVLLMRTSGVVYTNDESFRGSVEVANYGEGTMRSVHVRWKLSCPDGRIMASGSLDTDSAAAGGPRPLGSLDIPLEGADSATRLDLSVKATWRGGTSRGITNHWSIWVYPKKLPTLDVKSSGLVVAHRWDRSVKETLARGGRVLLLADTADLRHVMAPSFSGISWNTVWSGMPPNLLGILCNPASAALKAFPTRYYSNWQWWDLVHHSAPMLMDSLPSRLRPIVQMIPDWNHNNRIGLIFEARVGSGSLLVTSIDLATKLQDRPVARQMLYSLEKYAAGPGFHPEDSVSVQSINRLFK